MKINRFILVVIVACLQSCNPYEESCWERIFYYVNSSGHSFMIETQDSVYHITCGDSIEVFGVTEPFPLTDVYVVFDDSIRMSTIKRRHPQYCIPDLSLYDTIYNEGCYSGYRFIIDENFYEYAVKHRGE